MLADDLADLPILMIERSIQILRSQIRMRPEVLRCFLHVPADVVVAELIEELVEGVRVAEGLRAVGGFDLSLCMEGQQRKG